ncbi:unnamed protein product [Moneuplotes crassus]|uniref:Uncharacterized protein n=1 Tax=Euplotes crassus TaxID=5936 RepID=A0AAD1ULB1_EUPCR|nr:unnamed protein product [Moneuplotes crassus]
MQMDSSLHEILNNEKQVIQQESEVIHKAHHRFPFLWGRIEEEDYKEENVIMKRWLRLRFSGNYGIGLFVVIQNHYQLNSLKILRNSHSDKNRTLRIESYDPSKSTLKRQHMNEVIRILPTVTQRMILKSLQLSQKQTVNIFLNLTTAKKAVFEKCWIESITMKHKLAKKYYLESLCFQECKDMNGKDIAYQEKKQIEVSTLSKVMDKFKRRSPSQLESILKMIRDSSLSNSLLVIALKCESSQEEIEFIRKKYKLENILFQCDFKVRSARMLYKRVCIPDPDKEVDESITKKKCICF